MSKLQQAKGGTFFETQCMHTEHCQCLSNTVKMDFLAVSNTKGYLTAGLAGWRAPQTLQHREKKYGDVAEEENWTEGKVRPFNMMGWIRLFNNTDCVRKL